VDNAGNVFVADTYNETIRKVSSAGVVTTLAGRAGWTGSTDGTGSTARFYGPSGVAVDSAGNVFVADWDNCTIRKVTSAGAVTTLAGSTARFCFPNGVAVDSGGNVCVADSVNNTIRKVTAAGVVTTIGGVAGVMGGADGLGSAAVFA
jgi:sugar lactone lactonase YvrE